MLAHIPQAQIYEHEGNDQQAYLLLMRYAALVAERFPSHPQAHESQNKVGLKAARKSLPSVLDKLDLLKPRINARYAIWQKTLERRREANALYDDDRAGTRRRRDADPAVAGKTTTLAAAEHSDLAVQLAHNEIRRRETKRRGGRQVGFSEQNEQDRRTAGLWDDWEAALSRKPQSQEDELTEMQRNMHASRQRTNGSYGMVHDGRNAITKPEPPRPRLGSPNSANSEYKYPSIVRPQPITFDGNQISQRSRSRSPVRASLPPKPPKERFEEPEYEAPPMRPEKAAPEASRDYTFEPSAYLENGNPLRTVFLPTTLRERFLQVAASNTRNNLETCGMLCGTLVSNALFISQVVIPEQESTSDTCETINESAFFDYCATEDLMVLGWIHTHPSQTCFMSSRDLHTHCGYQIMMAESIAIVCAPSKDPS